MARPLSSRPVACSRVPVVTTGPGLCSALSSASHRVACQNWWNVSACRACLFVHGNDIVSSETACRAHPFDQENNGFVFMTACRVCLFVHGNDTFVALVCSCAPPILTCFGFGDDNRRTPTRAARVSSVYPNAASATDWLLPAQELRSLSADSCRFLLRCAGLADFFCLFPPLFADFC